MLGGFQPFWLFFPIWKLVSLQCDILWLDPLIFASDFHAFFAMNDRVMGNTRELEFIASGRVRVQHDLAILQVLDAQG